MNNYISGLIANHECELIDIKSIFKKKNSTKRMISIVQIENLLLLFNSLFN